MGRISIIALAIGLLSIGAAYAQEDAAPNCDQPTTQADMTQCAALDYKTADKELNAQYRKTKEVMSDWDAELPDDQKGAEKALLKAERAWIEYRDGHCEAVGFQARGGSMEPQLVAGCLADLTRARTKELKQLADGIGD